MASFTYTARDDRGQLQRGILEGASVSEVTSDLRRRGWLVMEVASAASESSSSWLSAASPGEWLPIRAHDVTVSFRQLAVMLRAGLTLLNALGTVAEQARRGKMRRVWESVKQRVEEGLSLNAALSQHACFPALAIQLTAVGEQTGQLETVLVRAAESMDSRRTLRQNMMSALLYPAVVLVMTFGVTAYMLFSLVPKLEKFLNSLGRKLPAMTQFLLDLSHFVRAYVLHGSVLLVASLATVIAFYNWPPGRLFIDRWVLRLPVLGRTFRLTNTILFARSLSLLLESGITLLEATRSLEQLLPNRYLAELIALARERVLQGSDLAEPLTVKGAFDPMLPRMIAVGEESGALTEVLDEVAVFHEQELQGLVKILGTLIEPIIICIIGGIVGFVYIAVFMALYAATGGS